MDSKLYKKRMIKLCEKYFEEKANISVENNSDFNIKIMDYITEMYSKENYDNRYLVKEKIYLKSKIESINFFESPHNYTQIFIACFLTPFTFTVGLLINSNNTYLGKMIDNRAINITDIEEMNSTIRYIGLSNVDLILDIMIGVLIVTAALIFLIGVYGDYKKKKQFTEGAFYSFCYDIACMLLDEEHTEIKDKERELNLSSL